MTINRMTILILYMNIYYCTDCILHWKQWCSDNGGNYVNKNKNKALIG